MQNFVLINNSRTAWPFKIIIPSLGVLQDACVSYEYSIDNFEVVKKHAHFWCEVQFLISYFGFILYDSIKVTWCDGIHEKGGGVAS